MTSSTSSAEACLDPADYFCVKFAALSREFTEEVDFIQVIDAFWCCKTSSFLLVINFVHCFIKTTLHYT